MSDDFAMGYALGQDNNSNCNDGFGGGGIAGIIWIIVIAALFGGGFGWGGGFGGFGGGAGLQGMATRADINAGFQFQDLQNGVRGIQQGLCDGFYAVNTGTLNGFHAVDQAISNLGYQQKDCCCETQRLIERGFCDTNYNLATNASNIVQAGHADTDRVIAKLDAMEAARQTRENEALRLENQTLRFQAFQAQQNNFFSANQDAQTAELIRRLRTPEAVPAYVVPNPNCCYGNPVGIGYAGGYNNGCGCGSCC